MTEAARLDRLESMEAIRQLVARYALATDSRDLDNVVDLFVDDVRVGTEARGRDALRAFSDRSLREVGVTILHVGTHVIDFDDADHARGVESPLGLPPANWPEHHTGTGELPEAWDSWREFWSVGDESP